MIKQFTSKEEALTFAQETYPGDSGYTFVGLWEHKCIVVFPNKIIPREGVVNLHKLAENIMLNWSTYKSELLVWS